MSATTTQPIPIVGQFFIHEESGKRYKFLMVEEVKEEFQNDEGLINNALKNFPFPIIETFERCLEGEAREIIDYQIYLENKKDRTFGPYRFYWRYSSQRNEVDITSILKEDHVHPPLQHAASKRVIEKVVEKLGVDIFRIAAGVEKR